MHAPYRIAARPEPESPDEADAYEALLRARASRARRFVTVACGALAVLSLMALAETPPSRSRANAVDLAEARTATRIANARDAIAAARAFAEREQVRFASTMSAVLDADLAPDRTQPPCHALPRATRSGLGKEAFPLLVVSKGDRYLPSPSVAKLMRDVNRADEHFAAGRTMDAVLYANALSARMANASAQLRYDVVLVTTTMKHPVRITPSSFEPGELTGRAYVYDFDEHRVTCAGDIHAGSSRTIEYSYVAAANGPAALDEGPRLSASLDEDLEVQIRHAITRGALFQVDQFDGRR